MELLKYIYLLSQLSVMAITVKSFQPNCDTNNQFFHYCFPITFCSNDDCGFHRCGRFMSNTKIVRVEFAKIIPKCAFTNSVQLRYIFGVNKDIEVVASRSFVNLPNVETINLSFNRIKQLHSDTFNNVSATALDLSWNKLVYIQEGAFHGLYNLRYLNLSKNELSTLSFHQMPLLLTQLNLSFNLFDRMALTSQRMPNLTDIDLSNNVLTKLALNFDNSLKKLDLSQNLLSRLDFMDIFHCEELKISSNRFFSVPEPLTYLSVEKVSLYPNPWNCDELQYLWAELQNNFVTLLDDTPEQTRNTFPICVASEKATFKLLLASQRLVTSCVNDENCDDNMICRNKKCLDPCKENACDPTSNCITINHWIHCDCPRNKKRDPREPYSSCLDAECFLKKDCFSPRYCSSEKKCISFHPVDQNSMVGGNGTSTSGIPASGAASYGAAFYGYPNTEVNEENEMWWINEIPKSSPTHKGARVPSQL